MVKYIPDISNERLHELALRIKPVIKIKGKLRYIRKVGLKTIAFTWDPKPTSQAEHLKPIDDIITYHTWAYYGFFKPTIAEVLAQIPEHLVDQVCAFRIIKHPENAGDLNVQRDVVNDGYHKAVTRLYRKN